MGEQPLSEYASCLLGSINLAEFVDFEGEFQFKEFEQTVITAVEGLNQALDEGIPLLPLEEQRRAARDWRNIGLGIFGLADMLVKMGIQYGSDEAVWLSSSISKHMARAAALASLRLAITDGAFPNCQPELIVETPFFKHVFDEEGDDGIIELVKQYGLRNCALLTIAPTGSLATMLGVSGGIEPIFSYSYTRKTESLSGSSEPVFYKVYTPIVKDFMDWYHLDDERDLPSFFVTAHDVKPSERIAMQAAWQEYIDASISSTVNLPETATVEDIRNIYLEAWKAGLKGITVYRDGCAREGVLTTGEEKKPDEHAQVSEDELPRGYIIKTSDDGLIGKKRTLHTGCGTLHLQTWWDAETGELLEAFFDKGSTGGCLSTLSTLSRMVSLAARGGVCSSAIIDQLNSAITCPAYAVRTATKHDTSKGSSCPSAIGKAIAELHAEVLNDLGLDEPATALASPMPAKTVSEPTRTDAPKCPECGAPLIFSGGCNQCPECGYSKCS